MKVILLEDVKTNKKKGQIVNVNDGYARNFILPKKLGLEATGKNLNDLKLQNANKENLWPGSAGGSRNLRKRLRQVKLLFQSKWREGGRTFGLYLHKGNCDRSKKSDGL